MAGSGEKCIRTRLWVLLGLKWLSHELKLVFPGEAVEEIELLRRGGGPAGGGGGGDPPRWLSSSSSSSSSSQSSESKLRSKGRSAVVESPSSLTEGSLR